MRAACVNPAELDGSAASSRRCCPRRTVVFDELAPPARGRATTPPIDTPFVIAARHAVGAAASARAAFSYLAVTVNADPADKRTDTISGDVVVDGKMQPAGACT